MTDVLTRLTTTLADRYRIDREIGAGGMATVYLAHDIRHDRDVAIKVLHPDLGAALGGDRFLAEIRTLEKRAVTGTLPIPPDLIGGVVASPDGRTLYYAARQSQANIWLVRRAAPHSP